MNAKRKSNSVLTVEAREGKLYINVLGAGVIVFDPALAHIACNRYAALHGWKQRLSDAAAKSRDTETGQPATPQEKYEAVKALAEYYMSGAEEWTRRGGGEGGGGKSITIEAIAMVKGVDYATASAMVEKFAQDKYEGDTKKALAYLRKGERVAKAIEEIRASRAEAPVMDADNALDDLMGE